MADLTLTGKNPYSLPADALVVATATVDDSVVILGDAPDAVRAIAEHAKALGLTGALDEVVRVPAPAGVAAAVLVLAGTGAGTPAPESLRRAAGASVRALGGGHTVLALPADDEAAVAAVAEGALLGAYAFARYRSSSEAPRPTVLELSSPVARTRAAKDAVDRAVIVAEAINSTRDLVNTAPNDLFPAAFADIAKTAAKGTGVKVTVLDEKALLAGGYGGIMGVGQGSTRGPRLVKIAYAPSRPAARVALVGKGITFDTGGISIKPAKGMEAMKSDMAGAAAVLGTVIAAARLGGDVAVTGYLCLAENMPGGGAQRPSDVITIRGGTTVEVLNTDAEGRLVMADGLVQAVEDGTDVVLDIATLTGAQIIALGDRVSGVMGTDDVRTEVVTAAEAAGEQFWPMPLPAELRPSLDSKVADIANIGGRAGGMLTAGLFLQEFTGGTPWAHLDIAGPSFNEGSAYGYTPVGGTGVGVRTLLSFIEGRSAQA
ncbi:leucyl aminopeptidase [Sanguibacter sp. A247]|uniref:leucyl aminopeptidase n=1 Tax=unclassified Sanguibacter TaxID=2645534 RepID=UPI003FD8FA7A